LKAHLSKRRRNHRLTWLAHPGLSQKKGVALMRDIGATLVKGPAENGFLLR
jgi:hypothetical protein